MAVFFQDGFDLYDNLADVKASGEWTEGTTASMAFGATDGLNGGGAIKITGAVNTNTSAAGTVFMRCTHPPQAFDSVYYYSFWHKYTTLPTGTVNLAVVRSTSNNPHVRITLSSAGVIGLINADFATVATGASHLANTWNHFELRVKVGLNSIGGEMELYLNGVRIAGSGSLDLYWSTDQPTAIDFYSINATTTTTYVDDLILHDASGSDNNTFMGMSIIDTLRPTANQTAQDWTVNTGNAYDAIDDAFGSSDGDSTYIETATFQAKSEFTMSDLPTNATYTIPRAVCVRSKAKYTSGFGQYTGYVVSGGVASNPTLKASPKASYVWDRHGPTERDPNGGGVLSDTIVNAMNVGLRNGSG